MTGNRSQTLSDVSETLLVTVYIRAKESQRPDALIKDEKAVALVSQRSDDFARARRMPVSESEQLTIILRNIKFDRYARDFLVSHPDAVVVHIGCGLDSRFERVDNGRVEWYDLDLPEVIELRRTFIGEEAGRYHLLGCSVLEEAWLDTVCAQNGRPFLFLAEGVFMYFEEAQVKRLVLTLRDHFPGAELVFDGFSPFHIWRSHRRLSGTEFALRFHWGLWGGEELERWGNGIQLLDDWGYLDSPEPRLSYWRWFRHLPLAAKAGRIYHFQLGKAVG